WPPTAIAAITLAKPVRSAPWAQWMRMGRSAVSIASASASSSGRGGRRIAESLRLTWRRRSCSASATSAGQKSRELSPRRLRTVRRP
ncbi:MAG TPA: hypothetical protein DCX07_07420, partial [Phycisphaerales bacterium]|nr:hypothetical protein [Phycisphaerales bacterium]